jgi:DNA-binding NtrC family response regulator
MISRNNQNRKEVMETQTNNIKPVVTTSIEHLESLIEQGKFLQAKTGIDYQLRRSAGKLPLVKKGSLSHLSAVCLYHLGQYKDALINANLAFEIYKDTSENNKVAQIQDILGRIYWGLGDLKKAELYIRDAISTYRRTKDYSSTMKCNNFVARILFTQCEFSKAIEYLNEARELSRSECDHLMEAKIAGNLGRIHILLGKWEKAEEEILISLKANIKSGDAISICRDQLSLGYVLTFQREFAQAKEYLSQALELAQKNDFLRELVIYHEYMGALCYELGQLGEAENHYRQIIDLWQKNAPDGDMISQTYRLLAEVQVARKEWDKAYDSCHKSLNVSQSLGEKIEVGVVYRILGQIYSARQDQEKTTEYFTKSISLLQPVGAKYELALTYLEAGRTPAFDYYKKLGFLSNSESLFRELESKYHLGWVNLSIGELLISQKDYGKAEVFLSDAEGLFKKSEAHPQLCLVADLRRSIEEILFRSNQLAKSNGKVTYDHVVTQTTEMMEIIEKLKQIKDYDISILLEGETGSGKDLIAKATHFSSRRRDKRFVAINCAALPESLLENELFGHRKGAYTGADKDQPGLFEEAEGGTLYLDQVEEIPLSTQVKLLRAIEEKEISRLGETKPRKIDVRIISSSIEDLKGAVRKGKFRQDLYFRINTFNITIPSLRERREDIPLLSKHFLKEYGVNDKRIKEFERNGTIKRFLEYNWPGNVRELENEIKRMVVLFQTGDKNPSGCLSEKLVHPYDNPAFSDENTLFHVVEEFEKEKIIEALKQCRWIKLRAAKLLGIPEATLRNKMKRFGISSPSSSPNLIES